MSILSKSDHNIQISIPEYKYDLNFEGDVYQGDNSIEPYCREAAFHCQSRTMLSYLRFASFFSIIPKKLLRVCYQTMTNSFLISFNLWFIHQPITRRCTAQVTKNVVKQLTYHKRQPTIGSSTADFSPTTIRISRFSQGMEHRYSGKYASRRYNSCD